MRGQAEWVEFHREALVRVEGGEFVTVSSPEEPWLCWAPGQTGWSEPEPTSFEG